MMTRAAACLSALLSVGCAANDVSAANSSSDRAGRAEKIVGGPCEGCELVFEGMPAEIPARASIAPPENGGPPMTIEGTVRDADERPAAGVIVYAYHTDTGGIYPGRASASGRAERRHGRLRGWAQTDRDGRYRIDTTRPGGYPDSTVPQHVHMHVIEPGRCTYYIDDILFDDDPRLTEAMRSRMITGRGGAGLVTPARGADGRWRVTRDIVLGERIVNYAACSASR